MRAIPLLFAIAFALATPATAQDYRFPLQMPSGTQPYITAHRDNSGNGGGLEDYACGDNTYDGHRGTDIGIGGFPVMDDGSRVVVAAAAGTVVTAVDGCFDRCTSGSCNCGDGFGNFVRIDHPDGKRTYYAHLKNGSVQVNDGDQVECGTPLGRVGSSGFSTGPHLHFEVRHDNNVSDDPFSGECGGPTSYWAAQQGYNELPDDVCEGGAPPPPPPPETGTARGAAFEDVGVGTADMSIRLAGASVVVVGTSLSTTATGTDAMWIIENAPTGTITLRASAPGYLDAERTCDVAGGAESWCSIGLVKAPVDPEPEPEPEPEPAPEPNPQPEPEEPVEPVDDNDDPVLEEPSDVERVTILPPLQPTANGSGDSEGCTAAGGAPFLFALVAFLSRRRR